MKAVVLTAPRRLELLDIPEPRLADEDQVLIKVMACGICGSDLRYWAGENPWALHTLGKHVENPPNMVMGHEFAGEVVKVNSPRFEHLLGRRVGAQSFRSCGRCRFCMSGRENLCRQMVHIGHAQGWGRMPYYPGGYAEYCLGWAGLVHPLADGLDFDEAAMADILCVAVHVLGRARLRGDMSVLCIGGGPAGLGAALLARARGVRKVFLADPSPLARGVASRYPDLVVSDPAKDDIREVVERESGAPGCGLIVDSVGSAETMDLALPLLEEAGTYVNMAVHDGEARINQLALGSERVMTTSSNAYYRDVSEAYELLNSGTLSVEPWITHRLPLERFEEAFDLLSRSPRAAYKVVFRPWSR